MEKTLIISLEDRMAGTSIEEILKKEGIYNYRVVSVYYCNIKRQWELKVEIGEPNGN